MKEAMEKRSADEGKVKLVVSGVWLALGLMAFAALSPRYNPFVALVPWAIVHLACCVPTILSGKVVRGILFGTGGLALAAAAGAILMSVGAR
jgi:hypothetical protein